MSHFIPDRERAPLVYWVGWLYKILIPATVGGMLLFVGADFARRRVDRRRTARAEKRTEDAAKPEDTEEPKEPKA
jgi:hypothetical protein